MRRQYDLEHFGEDLVASLELCLGAFLVRLVEYNLEDTGGNELMIFFFFIFTFYLGH